MHNNHSANELEMSRFGEYLLKSRVVPEKYAPYYVKWVRRFMDQVPKTDGLDFEDRLVVFLDTLKLSVEPWQSQQAEQAVRLYFSHYLTLSGTEKAVTEIKPDASGYIDKVDVMDATRRLIRLRHYSPSTERTYLGWLDRFFRYMASVGQPPAGNAFKLTAQSAKDYPFWIARQRSTPLLP